MRMPTGQSRMNLWTYKPYPANELNTSLFSNSMLGN